jgi:hypothetical protein
VHVLRRIRVLVRHLGGQRLHQRDHRVGGLPGGDGDRAHVEEVRAGATGDHLGRAGRHGAEPGLCAGQGRLGVEHGLQPGPVGDLGLDRGAGAYRRQQAGVDLVGHTITPIMSWPVSVSW